MFSHPETGSDSPIGSDQDRGRDRKETMKSAQLIRVQGSQMSMNCKK